MSCKFRFTTYERLEEIPITVDAERTIKNHESIVRALRNKDSAAYREAVQNHYAPLRAAIAQL